MNLKKTAAALSFLVCSLNSYASLYNSPLQTREEARRSYEIQREIARQNNDSGKLQQLNNNYNSHTRDTTNGYRNSSPYTYR